MRLPVKLFGLLPYDMKRLIKSYEILYSKTHGQITFQDEFDQKYTIVKHSKPGIDRHLTRTYIPDE